MEAQAAERVQRARAGSAAAAADRPSAAAQFVVRASSSVTEELISEEPSCTERTVTMRI